MPDQGFWTRLKRRKLVQWTVGYVAGAWLVLQVVGLLAEQLLWSPVIFRATLALLVAGFAVVLVLAWYHGERGRQHVTWRELLILAALVLLAGASVRHFVVAAGRDGQAAEAGTTASDMDAEEASIAVLPFVNLTGDSTQIYFGDGLAEELITELGQVTALSVAARTSSFAFRDRTGDVVAIGDSLRVARVLEGGFRREGNRVRVTARLVNARNGYEVWADTYDARVADIFAVQDKIVTAILEALLPRLLQDRSAPLVTVETDDPQAYELYLRARWFWNRRTAPDLSKAIDLFEAAIALDPQFAAAYAGLASTYAIAPTHGLILPDGPRKGEQAARTAIALDSTLSEAHAALGNSLIGRFRWDEAGGAYRRAIALNPSKASAHQWYGLLLQATGRTEAGLRESRRALELDPRSFIINFDLGWDLVLARRYQDGIRRLRSAAELSPSHPLPPVCIGAAQMAMGDTTAAIETLEHALADSPGRWDVAVSVLAYAYAAVGRTREARALLDEVEAQAVEDQAVSKVLIAWGHTALGETDDAFRWLRRAVADRDWYITVFGLNDPALDPLRSDPRFEEILDAARLPRIASR